MASWQVERGRAAKCEPGKHKRQPNGTSLDVANCGKINPGLAKLEKMRGPRRQLRMAVRSLVMASRGSNHSADEEGARAMALLGGAFGAGWALFPDEDPLPKAG
eukprot:3407640-Pyramimonas_sp.AAC.1